MSIGKLAAVALSLGVCAFSASVNAATYDVSANFTRVGGYTGAGTANIVNSGTVTVDGVVRTDSDAPGYSVIGGDITLVSTFNITALGVTVEATSTLTNGVPSNDGVIFTSGTVCVSTVGSSSCTFGEFTVGVPPIESVSFTSASSFLGETIAGLRLTGGAGGESFSVAQPGGVTPTLGNDPTDWAKAVGFFDVLGVLAGIYVEGTIDFTRRDQPNMVVIQVDDLGTDAFDVLIDGGWLPNIEGSLVESGVSFSNSFVTTPEGTPSRATLLTGQYAQNHKVYSNMAPTALAGGITWDGWLPSAGDPGREGSTLATWLQARGYRTGFVGEYLAGYGLQAPAGVADPSTYIPAGWDEWQGLIADSANKMFDYFLSDNGTLVSFGNSEADYQTDVLAGKAVDFINAGGSDAFFLLLTPGAVRTEITDVLDFVTGNNPLAGLGLTVRPAPRHAYLIDGDLGNDELPGLPTSKPSFNAADLTGKASCPRPLPPVAPTLLDDPFCVAEQPLLGAADIDALSDQYKASLAAMIAIDDLVGSVVGALENSGVLEETIIVFTSDNGRMLGEHRLFDRKVAYDESIRVPLVVRAPGGRAGVTDASMVLNNDIAPTLAAYAGATPTHTVDGLSMVPLIDASPTSSWGDREHMLVSHWYMSSLLKHDAPTYLAWRGIMSSGPDFVYIATRAAEDEDEVTSREFYNIGADPFQLSPIALPENVTDDFNVRLRVFEGCAGVVCRDYEMTQP